MRFYRPPNSLTLFGNGPECMALSHVLPLVISKLQVFSARKVSASLASKPEVQNAEALFVAAPLVSASASRDVQEFVVRLRTQMRWGGILIFLGSSSDVKYLRGCGFVEADLHGSHPAHALMCRPFAIGAFVNLFFTLRAWQPGALDRFINNYDVAHKFRELHALSQRLSSKSFNEGSIELLKQIAVGILDCKPLCELLRVPGHGEGPGEYRTLSCFLAALETKRPRHISLADLNCPAVTIVLQKYFERLSRTVFATI